jgi:hypothetical protein
MNEQKLRLSAKMESFPTRELKLHASGWAENFQEDFLKK